MLRRLTKCEFRYWATSPWFYSVVFAVPFAYISYMDINAYSDFKVTLMIMFPIVVFIGGLIMVMGWALEWRVGGTRTAMTMPVSRREFLGSKFTTVLGGQIFFLIVMLLTLKLSYDISFHNIFHIHYMDWRWTNHFDFRFGNGLVITVGLTVLASSLNFILALRGRIITAIVASGFLIVTYHIVHWLALEGASGFSVIPIEALLVSTLVLIVLSPFFAWKSAWRYFSEVKDIF